MGTYLTATCDGKDCKKEARMLDAFPPGIGRPQLPVDWYEYHNTGNEIRYGGRNTFHYCPECWRKKEAELVKPKYIRDKNELGKLFKRISNGKHSSEEHF